MLVEGNNALAFPTAEENRVNLEDRALTGKLHYEATKLIDIKGKNHQFLGLKGDKFYGLRFATPEGREDVFVVYCRDYNGAKTSFQIGLARQDYFLLCASDICATFVVDRNPEADFIDETNFRMNRWDRLNAVYRNFTSRVDKERALEFIGKIKSGEIHGQEINSVSETVVAS
ncbi:MAG: hypothetical protein G01um10145_384 [Microgenomates group bacterium Gr01-1014_5]|nr:MAG: hypothetical protein G01um10145_384 [Microgenomates group bacterium Gr01-1014_5]